jgi:hypothetical protein
MNNETINSAVPPAIDDSRGISSEVGAIWWQGENGTVSRKHEQKPPTPNSPLQWTQTLKGGKGSKVLFRSVPFAKEAWVH